MKYVAIKGMELPKSCAECGFVTDDMLGDATCVLLCDEWKDNENHRAENCPLIEIVTCKDCKYNAYETKIKGDESIKIFCRKNKTYRCIDGFCSEGKRRE